MLKLRRGVWSEEKAMIQYIDPKSKSMNFR